MTSPQMEQAIRDLQDAMLVISRIEKTQSEHIFELLEFRRRTENNLAEITDKLNGLIGFIAGQQGDGTDAS